MRRDVILIIVSIALSVFAFSALSQQEHATGSIEGSVVRADTGEPIANAQVTLASTSNAPLTTDPDGKFVFKDIPPGSYNIVATAPGFVNQQYGRRTLWGPGRPLFVTAGQTSKDATIQMTQTGTLSGRILDQSGQPATGAPVRLIRGAHTVRGKAYSLVARGPVNDQGDFRIFGVTPGSYYLMAGASPSVISLTRGGVDGFGIVYYPNARSIEQAVPIEVKSGAETSIDMRARRRTQTFRVRGRIVDPTGTALTPTLGIMLGIRDISGSVAVNVPRTFDPATGIFELSTVAPGDYTLEVYPPPTPQTPPRGGGEDLRRAELERQAQRVGLPAAFIPLHIDNADIEGLVLTLTTGVTVSGRLVVEGQPISSVQNIETLRLTVNSTRQPVGPFPMTAAQPFAADGTFRVVGLREEEYRVEVNVPGFYVKSLKYGDEDILGKPFTPSGSASATFQVTLRAGLAAANGTVTDAKSQPVPGIQVVFVPARRGRLDLFRTTITDENGKFTLTGLTPGEYKVFSWEAAENNAHFDPEFLNKYELQGKAVVVVESSNPTVGVSLIPAQ